MNSTAPTKPTPPKQKYDFRKRRRKNVKRIGKNMIRSMSGYFGRQSLVGDPPVFDPAVFPFTAMFEANWRKIAAEYAQVAVMKEHLPPFHELSRDQKKISFGDNWKVFFLFGFGYQAKRNCALCPETTRLLEQVPGLESAWFSILEPGYHIPSHCGVTKGLLRCHLGLDIPDEREKCVIRILDKPYPWQEGKCLVFDDTYEHEVRNDTPQPRAVLIFDFHRPMRWPARLLSHAFLFGIRRAAYVQTPRQKLGDWEDRLEAAFEKAEAFREGRAD